MCINRGSKEQKDLYMTSGDKTNKGGGLNIKERTYLQGFLKVEGPACELEKAEGIFSKSAPVDRYGVFLTRGLGEFGSSAPDLTTGNTCKRPGSGGRAGADGTRRWGRRRSPKMSFWPLFQARFDPT
jgi:hypothetical protein